MCLCRYSKVNVCVCWSIFVDIREVAGSACLCLPLLLSGRKWSSRRRGGQQHQRHMGKLSYTAGAPCCVLIGPCSPLPRYQMPSHEIWIQISQHVVIIENKPKPEKTQNPTQLQREMHNNEPPSDHLVNFYFPYSTAWPRCPISMCITRYLCSTIS